MPKELDDLLAAICEEIGDDEMSSNDLLWLCHRKLLEMYPSHDLSRDGGSQFYLDGTNELAGEPEPEAWSRVVEGLAADDLPPYHTTLRSQAIARYLRDAVRFELTGQHLLFRA